MRLREARKLTGIDRMIPKKVAIMPMKIVSTMREMTTVRVSLGRTAPTEPTCRAST